VQLRASLGVASWQRFPFPVSRFLLTLPIQICTVLLMVATNQLGFRLPKPPATHGGRRKNAGRKPSRSGTWMGHKARPWHDANHPVHVTMRVRRGIPSLRGYSLARTVTEALRRAAQSNDAGPAARRRSFRVVHYSIQPNHLHLIVEATSKVALARGMQGLASGLARRVNRTLRRRGSLFGDRYHAHALASPTEVRHAVVYVLKNFEKHPEPIPDLGTAPTDGIDPLSSARWFAGWAQPPPASPLSPPVAAPRTWLLGKGWKRAGLVARHERPSGALGLD
jgi:REP element-mobilizing transposase RayT